MIRSRNWFAAALTCVSAFAVTVLPSAPAQATEPESCQSFFSNMSTQFPVKKFQIPVYAHEVLSETALNAVMTESGQITDAACKAWNGWVEKNGSAATNELDKRYAAAQGALCNKFAQSFVGTASKYSPQLPADARPIETLAKQVWQTAMQKLSTDAKVSATCQKAYGNVKAGW
ncbi:hypothetical protein [Streptomyces sp. SID13588]|uniref:hypothetical protein n=1 Tax=Streptomyces sp. SID13588 TaxID=2706051 RepID=UPI0013CD815F|nr:hypothetical protein [Streptomyces sp. SID13588]NEA72746.1 hypothetical protein [Streptomyces sp. SID13588]